MPIHTSARRGLMPAASALALVALLPASSSAALVKFGSNLTASANVTKARQADTAYWQTKLSGGRSPRAPAAGQIKSFKIKGIALSNPVVGVVGGETAFHLQALRKRPDGTFKIIVTSGSFDLPTKGTNPQKITTYRPVNFCVAKGDVVAFNTVGGWDGITDQTGPYPMGTPLQIFSRVSGATVSEFSGAGQTNNGDTLKGSTARGAGNELLMQLTLGTKSNATGLCPGGTGH